MTRSRRGTILIVIAGLASIFAALILGFLLRMRNDGEEASQLQREFQARLMLSAGLQYIAECSRLGWDVDDSSPDSFHQEAFGWIDERNGLVGPRDQLNRPFFSSSAPAVYPAIGGTARCPAYVMQRPPWAVQPSFENPIDNSNPALPWSELINHRNVDPKPVAATWEEFRRGNANPRPGTTGSAWFRVLRTGPARFVITCGAGATQGYRDWAEVVADGAEAQFTSPGDFDERRRDEIMLWYETEWSPAIAGGPTFHYKQAPGKESGSQYFDWWLSPIGSPRQWYWRKVHTKQHGGSFLYIERLTEPPSDW